MGSGGKGEEQGREGKGDLLHGFNGIDATAD